MNLTDYTATESILRNLLLMEIFGAVFCALIAVPLVFVLVGDWKFAVFVSTLISLNEFPVIIRDFYLRMSKLEEISSGILPIENKFDEKNYPSLSSQINNNTLWLKLTIIISLALFLRVTISKRILPIAFCLDYLLIELLRYVGRIYVRLFHCESVTARRELKLPLECSHDWSDRKIITISGCINVIRMIIILCAFMVTAFVIPAFTIAEIRNYCNRTKISEKETLTLKSKIINRIKPVMERYPKYLIALWCNIIFYVQSFI